MPIKISIIDDVGSFLKGVSRVEDGLDDVAGSLDDVAREAQRTGTKAADALDEAGKDMARTTETATEKMERSFADLADAAKKSAKKTGDAVGDETRGGTRKAAESVDEFKDEARQNFSEVASSFSGGIDSAADLVQGTLGGLAGSLAGPAGLAAGVLAGVGGALFASVQENAEKSEERISAMYEDMTESGNNYVSENAMQQAISDMINSTDGAIASWKEVQATAAATGVSASVVMRAWAGDTEAQAQLTAAVTSKQDELRSSNELLHKQEVAQRSAQEDTLQGVLDKLAQVNGETSTAADRARAYRDAVAGIGTSAETATGQVGGLKSAWDAIDPNKTLTAQLNVDTSQADKDIERWRANLRPVTINAVARVGTPQVS